MNADNTQQILDARGLICPLPVLRARKLLQGMAIGDTLLVRVSDPSAPQDFAQFCEEQGHALEDIAAADTADIRIRICRGETKESVST